MNKAHFPFSAVCGQDTFKLALVLAAINPAIGGVVISGPRGSAKSTLARGLADLLPAHLSSDTTTDSNSKSELLDAEFVTLPLGASEEMLLGTLDLEHVLNEKTVRFSPGLLSKADGGVLYVDEVNLLPDNLVDLLLDVATSGENRVERDGISHSHRSEFLLVGTMNPDEGELRPQLHDRFGLSVQLDNQYSPLERVEIVKRREAFDQNSTAFCQAYAAEQELLLTRIKKARSVIADVKCDDQLRLVIAERCSEAQVDGLRADIVWYRAACAHAALNQRSDLSIEDIDAVEELVLAHRRKAVSPSQQKNDSRPPQEPPSQEPPSAPENKHGFQRPDDSQRQAPKLGDKRQQDPESEGEWGSMQPQQQKTLETVALDLAQNSQEALFSSSVKTRSVVAPELSNRPDWFSTLLSSLPSWPPKQLKFKSRRQSEDLLHLVLLDTSASTLKAEGFAHAKGALLQISNQAYLAREQLALFGFGNNQVDTLLPKLRAPKELGKWLDNLPAGGGTPMREVFIQAKTYLEKLQRQNPQLKIHSYVLTDGRSSSSLEGIQLPGELVWIDTELSTVKRGKGQRFAEELNATYLSLAGAC
ncbi:ATP-binding protein [Neptuniibacter sp. UBA847]|uniref:ATP-binding protein n=2 Tax=unclassified Neptuniibacter TaxID=2630693 RepID=UPI000C6866A4|nr:ATP-binding protein [Neptuniibacter sp. UBA847]MAY42920.1 magnesium chelatase [Oceanospirillaceae bacterium]|tara:strand:- start:3076 stop:4842 length:1767 start_codon:yes stop_codon:yes gene_type:complete